MKKKATVKDYDSKSQPNIKAIVVYWDDENKRQRKYFKVKAEAQRWANTLNLQVERYGKQARNLSEADTQDLILAKKYLRDHKVSFIDVVRKYAEATELLKPYKASVDDAINHFIEWNTKKTNSIALRKAIDEYTDALEIDKKSKEHIDKTKQRLKRFMGDFKPSCIVAMIEATEIDKWLNNLTTLEYVKDSDTPQKVRATSKKNISPKTKENYKIALNAFFNYCLRKDYLPKNPIDKVQRITVKTEEPEIYTVNELSYLLHSSAELSQVRLYIALGAFAGLRSIELKRLTWENIHLAEKEIIVDAGMSKTNQRRIVDISDNLLEWLKPYISDKLQGGLLFPSENALRNALDSFKEEKNIAWIHNGLRHSAASYHLAQSQNAPLTAERMGHTVAMLKKHYMGLVRPAEAKKYWNITPKGKSSIIDAVDILKEGIA